MTYLVFRGNKFIGHTTDKKILKRFLKERKTKYRVEEIETVLLSEEFKDSNEFHARELMDYDHYGRIMTEEDLIDVTVIGRRRLSELVDYMKAVRKDLKNIKLDHEERLVVEDYFRLIEQIGEDLTGPESCVFLEDYMDVKEIINLIMSMR